MIRERILFKAIVIAILIVFTAMDLVNADSSTLLLGVYGNENIYLIPGNQPSQYPGVELFTLFDYRTAFLDSGFFALTAKGNAALNFSSLFFVRDEEFIKGILSIGLDPGEFGMTVSADASIAGNEYSSAYIQPRYSFEMTFGQEELSPFIAYEGSWLYQTVDVEDSLYQGGKLGLRLDSAFLEMETYLAAGYEAWFEYPVYDSSGADTNTLRQDILIKASSRFSGLLLCLMDWSLKAGGLYRLSNSNRYLSVPVLLDASSEDRFEAAIGGSLGLSPNKFIGFTLESEATGSWYLFREALTASGHWEGP
jgi:hypothetical protein